MKCHKIVGFAVVLVMVSAFVFASGDAERATTQADATVGNEAPMLAARVAAGELPPLEQRIPLNPKLTNEIPARHLEGGQLEIGRYGGTLRVVASAVDWNPDLFLMFNEPLLNTPGALGEEVYPNIVESFELNDDSTVFTFRLREGLRWSDGELVTTEDIRFTVEDVLFNRELTPIFPHWLRAGSQATAAPMNLVVVDDYTFRIEFESPYGRFPIQLALTSWRGYTELLKPSHYLKAYHADYTDVADMEADIRQAGFEPGEWYNLFHDKDVVNWDLTRPKAIGFPSLQPFVMVRASESASEFERNPYYFKVDAAGNQLPYIDRVQNRVVQDSESSTMDVIAGNVDFMREDTALNEMPLYREHAERGGYVAHALEMHVDPTSISLNQTYNDPVWREVVRNVQFRRALNMAIDRQQINDAIYFNFGSMPELVPSEFNPAEAERILDSIGMTRGSDGYRIGPDGRIFEIPFEVASHAVDIIPVTEMVTEMWEAIGIRTTMRTIDTALRGQREAANELKATVLWNVQPMWRSGGWLDFRPTSREGRLWWQWYSTDGSEGEEPPEYVKRLYDLGELIMTVYPGTPEDNAYFEEIYQIHYDNVIMMPIVERVLQPLVVNADIGNVPIGGTAVAVDIGGEQLFFRSAGDN